MSWNRTRGGGWLDSSGRGEGVPSASQVVPPSSPPPLVHNQEPFRSGVFDISVLLRKCYSVACPRPHGTTSAGRDLGFFLAERIFACVHGMIDASPMIAIDLAHSVEFSHSLELTEAASGRENRPSPSYPNGPPGLCQTTKMTIVVSTGDGSAR